MTQIRQETQILNSDTYDDTVAAGSTLESAPTNIEADLNALRSQVKRIFAADSASDWFQDVQTVTSIGSAKKRGINQLAVEVDDIEEHRFLFRSAVHVAITVPVAQNWVVLSVAGSETPTETAATVATTKGCVVVQAGVFDAHALTEIAGPDALSPKNLCLVHDAATGAEIQSGGRQVYALIQSEIATDGHTFNDTTQQVQLSFVRANATNDDLEACPVADIQSMDIHYAYTRRIDFDSLPEGAFLSGTFSDQSAAGSSVTLDNAIDNQVGNATQTAKNILWEIDDNYRFAFRDAADTVDIFAVKPAAAGDEIELNLNLLDINNATPVDMSQGLSVDTADQAINIGTTAGVISTGSGLTLQSGGGGDLRLLSALEVYFDDVNQSGSTWAQTNGIKLSETTAEWNAFETAYGETSLLDAIVQAGASGSSGTVRRGTITGGSHTAGTNIAFGVNIDTQLQDFSSISFPTEIDIYVNGLLQVPAAGATEDVYPGTTPANGDLKFTYRVSSLGSSPDVITAITHPGRTA